MRFIFYSPVSFENWDFRTPDATGIGGSETCVAEVARRLAGRGHDVIVYAPLAAGCPDRDSGGARWLPLEDADFTLDGIWVLSRCPQDVDRLCGQRAWVVCQDVEYAQFDGFTPGRVAKMERILALCSTHRRYYARRYSHATDKVCVSGNGVKVDLIREVEAGWIPPRDPFRIIHTSSPDRGLINLLHVFRRAREFEPRLNLVVAYGLDNIRKCEGAHWRAIEGEVDRLLDQPGVTWLGRVGQRDLYREFLASGLWAYPTDFQETSCVSCMEAQALGAIPVCSPLWALEDNVRHGVFVQGEASDPMTRARFVRAILSLAWDEPLQAKIRSEMVPWARERFNWERVVDDYEGWASSPSLASCASWYAQYAFQLRHARGRVLNVGCNCDLPGFGTRGAINVDLLETDPFTGVKNRAAVIADARRPLPFGADFDTVLLGDILEHMTDDDATRALVNAKACLAPGGRILLTVPEDHRPEDSPVSYAADIPGGHPRPVTRDVLLGWLGAAGLRAELEQPIDYGQFTGRGVVAGVALC